MLRAQVFFRTNAGRHRDERRIVSQLLDNSARSFRVFVAFGQVGGGERAPACQRDDKASSDFLLTNVRLASLFAVRRQKRVANADAMDRLAPEPVPVRAERTTRVPAFSEPRRTMTQSASVSSDNRS